MKINKEWPRYCRFCKHELDYYLDFESYDSITGRANYSVRARCSTLHKSLWEQFLDGFLFWRDQSYQHTDTWVEMAEEDENGEIVVRVPRKGSFKWGTLVPGSNK